MARIANDGRECERREIAERQRKSVCSRRSQGATMEFAGGRGSFEAEEKEQKISRFDQNWLVGGREESTIERFGRVREKQWPISLPETFHKIGGQKVNKSSAWQSAPQNPLNDEWIGHDFSAKI